MAIVPINLPPGLYKNGTPYSRKGRWINASLTRWHDGSLRPIGGWERRERAGGAGNVDTLIADDTLEAIRDVFAWRSNNQSQNSVFGSNLALYHLDSTGVVTDVTYAGFTPNNSSKDAAGNAGYGGGRYGIGSFGTARALTGEDLSPPDRWYADNFGEVLLAGVRNNGTIYELDLGTLTMSAVTDAPSSVMDLCVTDQRQVFAVATDGEPRRVRSTDIESRVDWTPAIDNQSIDRVLPGSGKLLRCVNVLRQVLILGETDLHVARYIGPPYVYAIDPAGENCGPLAPEAVARTERFAAWWGQRNFWIYDGSLQVLPCDVIDFLYDDIEPTQISKVSTFTNTDFTEVWWLYQSNSSTTTEVDSYVVWDYEAKTWNVGRLDRTCGVDKGVFTSVVMVSSDGIIYNHELDAVLPTGDVFAETGPLELGNGEVNMAVQFIYPDTENTGGIEYTLYGKAMPNATEYTYGPYTYESEAPIPTTGAMGRQMRMRIDFSDADAEAGNHRFDVAKMGTGRR